MANFNFMFSAVLSFFTRTSDGDAHSLMLTRGSGEVWSWGYNESLQLGWADAASSAVLRSGFQKPRAPLPELPRIAAVACGEAHSACLAASGEVYAWGDNSTGQCAAGVGGFSSNSRSPWMANAVPVPSLLEMPRGDCTVRRLRC